jgi:hypothetical protein
LKHIINAAALPKESSTKVSPNQTFGIALLIAGDEYRQTNFNRRGKELISREFQHFHFMSQKIAWNQVVIGYRKTKDG